MSSKKLLNLTALLGVLIAVLSFVAIQFGFYIKFWYTDIFMHFIGGLFVGSFFLWFWFYSGYFRNLKFWQNKKFLCIFLSTLTVVILWEIFEYSLGLNKSPEGYVLDTAVDMILGILGAITAYRVLNAKMDVSNE